MRESQPESITVTLRAHELAISPEQVARYAGGARYRVDASQMKVVHTALERAWQLIEPAYVYRVYDICRLLEGGCVELRNGMIFPVPSGKQDSGMQSLAFCICTIGGRLEKEAGALSVAGDPLASLFLDAAGVAFLEALSTRAHETLQKHAEERHLQAGCRFGPGYGNLELSYQKQLFELVAASAVGVALNESYTMIPAKSLSFVTAWTSSRSPQRSRNKCASCSLNHCLYRL